MRRQLLSVAFCVGLLASCPPAALAQGTNAPPGNSGVDQYLETVPEAGGNRPRGGGDSSSRLPARTVQRLKNAGVDGKAVANLVASTGTARSPSTRGGTNDRAQRDSGSSGGTDSQRSSSVPKNIAAPTLGGSGPGGMGIVLPLLLALSAAGAVLFALRRRRQG